MVIPGGFSSGVAALGTLTYKDLSIIEKVPHVAVATPIIANKVVQYTVQGKTYRATVYGITEDFQKINQNAKITEGRGLVRSDNGVVIIGANVALPQNEASPVLGIGDRLTLHARIGDVDKTLTVRVIGILERTGASFGVNLDDSIALSIRDTQQFFETGNQFSYIMAQADTIQNVASTAVAIKAKMGKSYSAVTYESAKSVMDQVVGSIQAVLGGIAAISLIVAGIGIINTMTISVLERTREIGVFKAIGAKSRHILLMFLSEAVFTGLIGGILGVLIGFSLSGIIGATVGIYPAPSLTNGILVTGFAVLTSTFSGIYPAWRAANLNPVEALRSE
jgi:putative ABC transport system permease protein